MSPVATERSALVPQQARPSLFRKAWNWVEEHPRVRTGAIGLLVGVAIIGIIKAALPCGWTEHRLTTNLANYTCACYTAAERTFLEIARNATFSRCPENIGGGSD